jgi:hypothetical protein
MDTLACPECGAPLESRQDGLGGGTRCAVCGWSVVTTVLPGILRDTTRYEVHVLSADPRSHAQLRTIANVTGQGLVQARERLEGRRGFVAFSGTAAEVSRVRDAFRDCGLRYEVRPDFPW